MTIKEKLQSDVKDAMKAQQKEKLAVLRLIMAAFKQVEVDERITLDETRELVILDKMLKQRNESIAQFKAANRDDLVQKEQFEIEIIQNYLPAQLSDAEVEKIISAAISETNAQSIQDMGKVMNLIKPKLQGRADLGQAGAKIKALLANAK